MLNVLTLPVHSDIVKRREQAAWHDRGVTPGTKSDQPQDASQLLEQVAKAAQELRDVEEHQRTSASRLAEALLTAHRGGFSWSEVARAADMASAETARTRAYSARSKDDVPPSLRWRREQGSTPRPRRASVGLSVAEASSRLKVSEKTVYTWVHSGKLASSTDEAGRIRVLLSADQGRADE